MKSQMMTLRIAPELLAAVKARAKKLGRSASAEVVLLLERELKTPTAPLSPVMGMFSDFEDMDAEELRKERKRASRRFLAAARETAAK
jgi:hypothetical protein